MRSVSGLSEHRIHEHARAYILERNHMKLTLNIIAVIVLLAGITFFLQGINILPGSYMTGDPQWAVNGGVMVVIALGLLLWANRRK